MTPVFRDEADAKQAASNLKTGIQLAAQRADRALRQYGETCHLLAAWADSMRLRAAVAPADVSATDRERVARLLLTLSEDCNILPSRAGDQASVAMTLSYFLASSQHDYISALVAANIALSHLKREAPSATNSAQLERINEWIAKMRPRAESQRSHRAS